MDPYTHAPCVIARNSVSGFRVNPSACRRCHKGRAHVFVHPLGLGKMPSRQIELKIKLIALKSWDAFQVGGRARTLRDIRTAVGTTMPAKVSPGGSGWTGCP